MATFGGFSARSKQAPQQAADQNQEQEAEGVLSPSKRAKRGTEQAPEGMNSGDVQATGFGSVQLSPQSFGKVLSGSSELRRTEGKSLGYKAAAQ